MGAAEFLIVLGGGSVTTFLALAIIQMIGKGKALRARDELETTRDATQLDRGSTPSMRHDAPEAATPLPRRDGPGAM